MATISHSDKRKSEIIRACRELYQTMAFKDITIKEISEYTSFSRPSIYNYFATKESIFLEIFREEYTLWCDNMDAIITKYKALNVKSFADKLARTLENRPVLLKLLSMNLYDLEENCSLADLTMFKREYRRALDSVEHLLAVYFPRMNKSARAKFIYTFFPFMFGLYPYANVTQKQKQAMISAGIKFPTKRVYDFAYQTIFLLLNNQGGHMNSILSSVLIAYFSATGTTANVAQKLASALDAPIYEIRPAQPYTDADLNWHDENSRSSLEMDGKIPYPELADLNAPVANYDTIFLGFPIWWGTSPKIVNQFVKSYDLTGKKVILFATSGSSGLGDTASDLQQDATGTPEIINGRRFPASVSTNELKTWAESIKQ